MQTLVKYLRLVVLFFIAWGITALVKFMAGALS